jgi:hypothetical protein
VIARPLRCLAIAALLLLARGAPSARAVEMPVQPGTMLTIKAAPVTVAAGETTEAVVTIQLLPDYEIIAQPPNQYSTGASLAVESGGGIVARTPVFPPSTKVREYDGGMEVEVWKGPFEVRVPIQVSAKAQAGERILHATFRYQARFNGEFYKVATRRFDIPVTIVKAKKATAGGASGAPATRP